MLDNFEINEQKRINAAKLIERNLGTYYEGANQNYIHTLQQQSLSSSSNAPMIQLVETKPDIEMAKQNDPETSVEPKGSRGRPRSIKPLESRNRTRSPPKAKAKALPRAISQPIKVRERSASIPVAKAKAKTQAQPKAKAIEIISVDAEKRSMDNSPEIKQTKKQMKRDNKILAALLAPPSKEEEPPAEEETPPAKAKPKAKTKEQESSSSSSTNLPTTNIKIPVKKDSTIKNPPPSTIGMAQLITILSEARGNKELTTVQEAEFNLLVASTAQNKGDKEKTKEILKDMREVYKQIRKPSTTSAMDFKNIFKGKS